MIRFNNDYNHGTCPEVLEALKAINDEGYDGYAYDPWCEKTEALIRDLCGRDDLHVHFCPGATQANYIVCAALLRSIDSVLCASTGHINTYECASVENTGHRLEIVPHHNGKLIPEDIEKTVKPFYDYSSPEYWTIPKMVYLTFPTEFGTLYSKEELAAISEVCKKYDMYLFMDGARLGYGLGSEANDLTLHDIAELCDVFYFGGTKCGALYGEAIVISNPALEPGFINVMKQNGAVLGKSWAMAVQFYALLKDGLYFDITRRADEYAMLIKTALQQKGIPFYTDSFTNQQFVFMPQEYLGKLSEKYLLEDEGPDEEGRPITRLCTSWSTKKEDTEALVKDILAL